MAIIGIKPLFTQLNLNAWAFWIALFVLAVTLFALIRIIYLMCLKRVKRHAITVVDIRQDIPTYYSTQAIYTSVIAPHYFYGENYSDSVNAVNDSGNKYFEKLLIKKGETNDGVDYSSESCDAKATPIRPLTPAYTPHEIVSKEDPLGFLSVPPGFVNMFHNSANQLRVERTTHSA